MKKYVFSGTFFFILLCSVFFLNLIFYIRTLNYPQEFQKNIIEILKNQILEDGGLGISECEHEQYRFYLSYVKNNEAIHRYYSVDGKLYQEIKFNTLGDKEYKKEIGSNILKLYKEGSCGYRLKTFSYKYGVIY